MGRLDGKSIVVTGAGSGIGRAMALAFGAEGAHVFVADVRREPREGGDPTDAVLAARGQPGAFVATDVSLWSDVDALVGGAVGTTGKLDVFVNNAALHHRSISKSLLDTEPEDWDAMMGVNLRGTFFGCKRAIQQMLTQPPVAGVRGRVINVGSSHGIVGAKGKAAHCAIKAAIINLTRHIAVEYGPEGIVANTISPGRIVTGPADDDPDTDEELRFSQSVTPFPRLGTPEDVANGAVYLASDEGSFVSGANLVVDGGFTVR
jgi:glucose 1-dehydrogenase